tara:strand:- start:172817 stop:173665 length:849 start_codon:yes stop_codon:yes gene_type:complete
MAKKTTTQNKENDKPNCFIIMPITTPDTNFQQYKGDKDHFKHVLECLFVPAVEKAGFQPLVPESTGSEVIHADIIEKLTSSEMVLCDMSILNANVFFELGVRTSLNKPVALIVDDQTTKIPFDLQPAQRNTYKSALNIWENEAEIEKVADHIRETSEKSQSQNSLWKRFKILDTAEFNTNDVTDDDRFQVLYEKIDSLQSTLKGLEESKQQSLNSKIIGPKHRSFIRGKINQILSNSDDDLTIGEVVNILAQEIPEVVKKYSKRDIWSLVTTYIVQKDLEDK